MIRKTLLAFSIYFIMSQYIYSWGARGHDIITKVAISGLIKNKTMYHTYISKSIMLGHISNTPDVVWRNGSKEVKTENSPTHYIDLEYILSGHTKLNKRKLKETLLTLPKTKPEYLDQIIKYCKNFKNDYNCNKKKNLIKTHKINIAGTAIFRIEQLYNILVEDFKNLSDYEQNLNTTKKTRENLINQILLHSGLISHFIADISNPHHTTIDYDSFNVNQGGLHSYFETKTVNYMSNDLSHNVYVYLVKNQPINKLLKMTPSNKKRNIVWLASALALNSYMQLERLNSLDKKHSLTKPSKVSSLHKIRTKAERLSAFKTHKKYEKFAIERMALASSVLSYVWQNAHRDGGSPSLSHFKSYKFWLKPKFIYPTY